MLDYRPLPTALDVPSRISRVVRPFQWLRVASRRPGRKLRQRRQFRRCSTILVIPLIVLAVLLLAYLAHSVLNSPDHYQDAAEHQHRRRNGNQIVAADMYGLGVRIGLYTQAIGMLISAATWHAGGARVACAGTMLAFLVCWTRLARAAEFSPCEADLIGTLLATAAVAGSVASLIPDDSIIGSLGLGISGLWALCINFWLWATLYRTLPTLGTANTAWFFTEVRIDGWFRIFMLVLLSVLAVILVFTTVGNVIAELKMVEGGVREVDEEELIDELEATLNGYLIYVWVSAGTALLTLVFTIASAEMIIRYNGLQPEQSLTTPGQAIPLTIGIIVLLDGVVSYILL